MLKEPKTYTEQLEILKSRGLIVLNEKEALNKLSTMNYYSISGYLHSFKIDKNRYQEDITFEHIIKIMQCDRRIKSVIMYALDLIENSLKTKLAYVLAHETGALGYLNERYFKNATEHDIFKVKFMDNINRNRKLPFVKHHYQNYGGKFPVWVATELISMGMLCNLYKNLNTPLQKTIASEYNTGVDQLISWIENVTYLRNHVAHNRRLYSFSLQKFPRKCNKNFENDFFYTNKVFDEIYIMKFLISDKHEWNDYVVLNFSQIFENYKDYIDLKEYGFTKKWDKLLKIK
nr:MAG TPA: Abi-like protein [Caudoviricetes sp.]